MGPGEGARSRSRLGLGDEWTGPSLPLPPPGAAECSGWWGGWPKGVGANSEGPAVGLRAHYGVA